jgi:protein-S-isoprenylcysteine O-methyltransferase Ste14
LRFGLSLFLPSEFLQKLQHFSAESSYFTFTNRLEAESVKARRGGTWMQRWRVPIGFLSAPIFLLLARPRPLTLAIGAAVALPGLLLRAWASGYLKKNDVLATAGPYAHTRNPLYLGSFLIGLGFTIAAGSLIGGILFAIIFVGIYVPVIRVESATLAELFGEKYRSYAEAVPLFFPRVTSYRNVNADRVQFNPALYKRHREYQAALGFVIAFGLLVLKAWYFR